MSFESLHLIEPILKALKEEGYSNPTPIQAQSIPIVLRGTDLLGCAQTGTGKTAAFTLPIIQLLEENKSFQKNKKVRALIVTPPSQRCRWVPSVNQSVNQAYIRIEMM